jgi:hypothetical protein
LIGRAPSQLATISAPFGEVLTEYGRVAFADIRTFFDEKGNLIPVTGRRVGAWRSKGQPPVTGLRKRCGCAGWRCDHLWFADFRVRGRRYRVPLKTANKNLADQLATVERHNLLKAKAGIFHPKNITFSEFAKVYLKDHGRGPADREAQGR